MGMATPQERASFLIVTVCRQGFETHTRKSLSKPFRDAAAASLWSIHNKKQSARLCGGTVEASRLVVGIAPVWCSLGCATVP